MSKDQSQQKLAIAVLGKALIDESITCEFAMRIAAMLKHVSENDGEYSAVYFVGVLVQRNVEFWRT